MKKAIVVGGGVCGCTAAYLLSKDGWDVTLFEKEKCLGGGIRTFFYGSHPYTFGPRPLYTPYEKVYKFLNKFIPVKPFKLYLNTFIERDGQFYSFPIHKDDIPKMPDAGSIYKELEERPEIKGKMDFEEYYTKSVGKTLYDKFINNYSKKMWAIKSNKELEDFQWSLKGVALKTGTKQVRTDLIVAHPTNIDGYNRYFDIISREFKVKLNCNIQKFDVEKRGIQVNDKWLYADILVSTTSIDSLFDYCYGELKYIGRDFIKLVLPVKQVIPNPIIFLHYPNDEMFTRVVEYKKLYRYKSATTLLGMEIPSFNNKLYPYPIKKERERAKKYMDSLPKNVFSIGRKGRYVYDNIGEVVMQGFELIEKLRT